MFNSEYAFIFSEEQLPEDLTVTFKQIEDEIINNKCIPEIYPDAMINNGSIDCTKRRNRLIQYMGFALLSKSWIKPLADYIGNKKCLEVMAGTGALTKCLKDYGVNIIATDDYSWNGQSNWNDIECYWTDIKNIDAVEAVLKYGENMDYVICSWAYMDATLDKVLQTMKQVNPNCKLIYIGEDEGGCTASDDFFQNIVILDNKEFYEAVSKYQKWHYVYDNINLGK